MTTEEKNELEIALETRIRAAHEFEFHDFMGGSKKPLGKIRLREATVAEQDAAIREATAYAEKQAKSAGSVAMDPDLVQNAKTVHILHKVCLHATHNRPAFSGPQWMLEHLSAPEIGLVLNYYNEVVRVHNPIDLDWGSEKLEALAELCKEHASTDAPNLALANFNRDAVSEMAIRFAIMYREAKEKLDAAQGQEPG